MEYGINKGIIKIFNNSKLSFNFLLVIILNIIYIIKLITIKYNTLNILRKLIKLALYKIKPFLYIPYKTNGIKP